MHLNPAQPVGFFVFEHAYEKNTTLFPFAFYRFFASANRKYSGCKF